MLFRVAFLPACCLILAMCSTTLAAEAEKGRPTPSESLPNPESRIIDKWRGTWEVKATRRQPQPIQEVTYSETFEWILDGRYLRSETSRKSDGGRSMSMFWYDIFTKTYRFVVYDAAGWAVILPPPVWHEKSQTMEWKSGKLDPASYNGYATFTDQDTIRWKSQWKDWKGTVIFDLEGISIRQK
jgi:hypothetical protein